MNIIYFQSLQLLWTQKRLKKNHWHIGIQHLSYHLVRNNVVAYYQKCSMFYPWLSWDFFSWKLLHCIYGLSVYVLYPCSILCFLRPRNLYSVEHKLGEAGQLCPFFWVTSSILGLWFARDWMRLYRRKRMLYLITTWILNLVTFPNPTRGLNKCYNERAMQFCST